MNDYWPPRKTELWARCSENLSRTKIVVSRNNADVKITKHDMIFICEVYSFTDEFCLAIVQMQNNIFTIMIHSSEFTLACEGQQ